MTAAGVLFENFVDATQSVHFFFAILHIDRSHEYVQKYWYANKWSFLHQLTVGVEMGLLRMHPLPP